MKSSATLMAMCCLVLPSGVFIDDISVALAVSQQKPALETMTELPVTVVVHPVDHSANMKATEDKITFAQQTAANLFKAIEDNRLIVAGKSEAQVVREVTELARTQYGVETHWHKKIVRAGVNTMAIYNDNPPDRIIEADDIVIVDFGIVVDGFESDYARTFVLGSDPHKIKLMKDVEKAWYEIQAWYKKQAHVRASDLFAMTRQKAKENGWTSAGDIAGHIVGKYPHEQPADPKSLELDVHPSNPNDMFLLDPQGNKRHWILEVHFVDKEHRIGAYFEQLL